MSDSQDILVPDIGDFDSVDVIEVLVSPGDTVDVESPLITLESDKATMDIPSPVAGTVTDLRKYVHMPCKTILNRRKNVFLISFLWFSQIPFMIQPRASSKNISNQKQYYFF